MGQKLLEYWKNNNDSVDNWRAKSPAWWGLVVSFRDKLEEERSRGHVVALAQFWCDSNLGPDHETELSSEIRQTACGLEQLVVEALKAPPYNRVQVPVDGNGRPGTYTWLDGLVSPVLDSMPGIWEEELRDREGRLLPFILRFDLTDLRQPGSDTTYFQRRWKAKPALRTPVFDEW